MNEPSSDILANEISSQIEGFSAEEKEEILHQIDKISAGSRITITPELFEVKSAKKGGTFPLVINILGLIVIVGGFFFANRYFQAKEESMVLGEKTYQSTADSIVKELKKQAEEKLQQKEQEISKIQNELEKLDKESSALKATMESQIQAKEEELKIQMQRELENERARLKSTGVSSAELEKQLKEFQARKENDINAALQSFKAESEAALKEKEKELAKAKQVARQILDKANRDKATLEADAKKREKELTEQFNREKEALTKQSSEAVRKLEELNQLQRNEQLIQDQITGSYTTIMTAIKEGNFPKAEMAIGDVRKILTDPKIQNLPNIYKRVNIEHFILDSLENEIKQSQTGSTTDFTTLTQTAQILMNARANAAKGKEAEEKGKTYDAKRYYNAAIASLPRIQSAVKALEGIDAKSLEANSKEYINLGDISLKKGDLEDALDQFRSAAINATDINKDILSASIRKLEDTLNLMKKKLANEKTAEYRNLKTSSEKKISSLQDELNNKKSEIEKLGGELENKNTEIAKLKNDLKEESLRKADLEQKLADLQTKNSALTSNLAEKDTQIQNLSGEIARSSKKIESLTSKVNKAEKQVTKLQKELDDAVNQIVDLING